MKQNKHQTKITKITLTVKNVVSESYLEYVYYDFF